MLILIFRFLWVDLQFRAILDVCEEDGTPDRIPDLFKTPPAKVTELYTRAWSKLCSEQNTLPELAKNVFQWVVCSQRPLTIQELEEAISITANQRSWKSPSIKLDLSRLCRMCGNLVKYDKVTETVSLAHHTVLSFLLDYSNASGISSLAFKERSMQQYLADTCLTYLSFTNFHQAVTQTSDTTNVRALTRPISLVSGTIPSSIRHIVLPQMRGRRADSRQVDFVGLLRSELIAHQSARPDPSFQILNYSKTYWYFHSSYIPLQNRESLTNLEKFIRATHLPPDWKPWSAVASHESLPYWKLFYWTVKQGHGVIFCIWQNMVTTHEAAYWKHLWLTDGRRLFAAACATASFEQIKIILGAKGEGICSMRPSKEDIDQELVKACSLGHLAVVERLFQEKADVNAVAGGRGGRTALQAAAEGGHLAVVERLLQEKADVNAAAAYDGGRAALQAAAEGGHLAAVERLLQEKADVNAAAAGADSGRTALQAAAGGGHLAVVERLLQEKADVNAAAAGDGGGRTALQAAAGGGHLAVVERLRQEQARSTPR
jgi:hypothetical protein